MENKDIRNGIIVGFLVGLLALPILMNLGISSGYFLLLPVIFPVLAITGLYVANYLSRYIKILFQLSKFSLTGVLNAFIDVGVLSFLLWITKLNAEKCIYLYALFKFLSFSCHAINSYFWNKYWTFNKTGRIHGKEFTRFYLVAGIGAIINTLVATLLVRFSGIGAEWFIAVLAPIIGILVASAWDFCGYKFFIFKK